MISKLLGRAWLLTFIGASIFSLSPRFLYADGDLGKGHNGDRERSKEQTEERDREDGESHHNSDTKGKQRRNMHPELQIAAPFHKSNDSLR